MAEWRELTHWLSAAVRPGHVVGWRGGAAVSEGAFRAEVASWLPVLGEFAGCRVAIYQDDALALAAALLAALQSGCEVVLPGDLHTETLAALRPSIAGWIAPLPDSLRPLAAQPESEHRECTPWSADAARLILYTSGSSGAPQAIAKRLSQLLAEVRGLEAAFGERLGGARIVSTVSPQHIYGLLFRLLWPLSAGRALQAERLVYPEAIAAELAVAESILVATPAHLARLPTALDWSSAQTRLRAVFSSGGPLFDDAAQTVLECLGQAAIEVYGSSETGGIAWRQRQGQEDVWTPLPQVAWRIVGEHLEVRSPYTDAGAAWFTSSDRAQTVGAGFRLLGRLDRIVKIEERRVSLSAIEQALVQDAEVVAARVLVLPGARQQLGAVIVERGSTVHAAEARRARIAELRQRLAAVTDRVAWPRRWRFVESLPVDARGKTSEAALRALFAQERPTPLWLRREANHAELECSLDAELTVFDGHFPEQPVLPGVALLDWAARWGREQFGHSGELLSIEQLKFQRIARPGLRLSWILDFDAAQQRLSFAVRSPLGPHASGRLRFAPP